MHNQIEMAKGLDPATPYAPPKLIVYGAVSELTMSGVGSKFESGATAGTKKPP